MYPLNDAEHMEWHVGPRVSGVPAGHTNDTKKLLLKQTEIKKKRYLRVDPKQSFHATRQSRYLGLGT